MSSKSPKTHRQVIDKILKRLAEAEKPLPSSLEFYRRILAIQSQIKTPDLSGISQEKVNRNLVQKKPAITFSDLKIDWENTRKLFDELTKVTVEFLAPESEEIDELKRSTSDLKTLEETSKAWFASNTLSDNSTAKNEKFNSLTASILQAAFYPLLSAYSHQLQSLVPQDSWYQRYCPICGGGPDFSFLDKENDGARWLLCSRCDAQWLFYRLVCPHCGNQEQQKLAYLTDDTGLYRLYVCENCRRYIKTIDLRKTETEVLLPLERILTLDLDRQAHESNYKAE